MHKKHYKNTSCEFVFLNHRPDGTGGKIWCGKYGDQIYTLPMIRHCFNLHVWAPA